MKWLVWNLIVSVCWQEDCRKCSVQFPGLDRLTCKRWQKKPCDHSVQRKRKMFKAVLLCRVLCDQSCSNWRKKGCLTLLSIRQQNQISRCGLFSLISLWKWLQQNDVSIALCLLIVHAAFNHGGRGATLGGAAGQLADPTAIQPDPIHSVITSIYPAIQSPHSSCVLRGTKRKFNAPDEAIVEREFPFWSPVSERKILQTVIINASLHVFNTNGT